VGKEACRDKERTRTMRAAIAQVPCRSCHSDTADAAAGLHTGMC